jgi:hypothetical protein
MQERELAHARFYWQDDYWLVSPPLRCRGRSQWVFDVEQAVERSGGEILRPQLRATRGLGCGYNGGVPIIDLVQDMEFQRAANQGGSHLHDLHRFQRRQLGKNDVRPLMQFAQSDGGELLQYLRRNNAGTGSDMLLHRLDGPLVFCRVALIYGIDQDVGV